MNQRYLTTLRLKFQNGRLVSKRATLIEWQVAEDDKAWNEFAQQPSPTAPIQCSLPASIGQNRERFAEELSGVGMRVKYG